MHLIFKMRIGVNAIGRCPMLWDLPLQGEVAFVFVISTYFIKSLYFITSSFIGFVYTSSSFLSFFINISSHLPDINGRST